MPKKKLYINVVSSQIIGSDEVEAETGYRLDGYSHNITKVSNWGPVFYAIEGRGYLTNSIEDWDKDIDWENYEETHVFIVCIRFTNGGSCGRNEHQFCIEYVTDTREKTEIWLSKNREQIEKAYNCRFDRFEEIELRSVDFKKAEDVPKNDHLYNWIN